MGQKKQLPPTAMVAKILSIIRKAFQPIADHRDKTGLWPFSLPVSALQRAARVQTWSAE
jgi:hypothetical protein